MSTLEQIKILAFDADDTLWDCQPFFDEVSERYSSFLSHYGDRQHIAKELFKTEMGNMEALGYGTKAFVISLVENAIRISNYRLTANETEAIITLGRSLLQLPATPLPGVTETLQYFKNKGCYKMVVFTKGDQLEQEQKLQRSALEHFFDKTVVVSDKTPQAYLQLCKLFDAQPHDVAMIGNSLKSDIHPALEIGCYAIHIPHAITWQHEHAEPIEHERLITIETFSELRKLL